MVEEMKKRIPNPNKKRISNLNKKCRLNPTVDFYFYKYLGGALVYGSDESLANAVYYYNVKNFCTDCDKYFADCTCEGNRDLSGSKCGDCKLNYCLCDYNLYNNKGFPYYNKVRQEAWNFAKNKLTDVQLENFVNITFWSPDFPDLKNQLKGSKLLRDIYQTILTTTKASDLRKI